MSRPSKEQQKATVIAFLKLRAPRPVLIGQVAVHLGWWATLPETEALLEEMVKEGSLRRPTKEEFKIYGIRYAYLAVV